MVNNPASALKLLLSFDIIPERANCYYEFMLNEMVPRMQVHGLHTIEAWHTAYGDRPLRLIVMAARDLETLECALDSEDWRELEGRLLDLVTNYERRVATARSQFQFFNTESRERF
jgi:hypothetical protein